MCGSSADSVLLRSPCHFWPVRPGIAYWGDPAQGQSRRRQGGDACSEATSPLPQPNSATVRFSESTLSRLHFAPIAACISRQVRTRRAGLRGGVGWRIAVMHSFFSLACHFWPCSAASTDRGWRGRTATFCDGTGRKASLVDAREVAAERDGHPHGRAEVRESEGHEDKVILGTSLATRIFGSQRSRLGVAEGPWEPSMH